MRRFANPPALLVAAAVIFGAVLLGREWRVGAPQINDAILHEALAQYAALHWDEHWPVDFWFPDVSAGFPMFAHYPHLSHLTAAALAHAASAPERAGRVYDFLRTLLLTLVPLSIFVALRRMRLDDWTAAFAALLYPLLASRGSFGIGWDSAVWRASGLGPQVWGTFFLFPALAWGYAAVRDGRSALAAGGLLALCFLSHFLYGYMAALSIAFLLVLPDRDVPWRRRLPRLARVAAVAALATAYFTVPFALHTGVLLHSRWEPQWKWDSFGWSWVLTRLARGELFDAAKVPVLSVLVGLGLLVAIVRARRDPALRWIAACFALWIVLFTGRAGLGAAADLLPLSGGLHMHRFIGSVQAFGLMLAGLGASAGVGWLRGRLGRPAVALPLCAAALALLLAAPVRKQIAYMKQSTQWASEEKEALARAYDLRSIVGVLRRQPPGRVHAGFHGTWGKEFKIGREPLYSLLQTQGFDMVGYLFMAMARPGEWQVRLDYRRRDHCDLFDLRYVVAPRSVFMPRFARRKAVRGDFALYEMPTSGYFTPARVEPLAADALGGKSAGEASGEEIYALGDRWLQGRGPAERRLPALDGSTDPALPAAPSGVVLEETVRPNLYEARVANAEPTDVVLKVTYHPSWRAEVDGVPVAVREVLPSFMAVRLGPGHHTVRFTYEPPRWKRLLFWVGASVIAAALVALGGEAVQSGRKATRNDLRRMRRRESATTKSP
jgi:Bacterial membrane protein YfhO